MSKFSQQSINRHMSKARAKRDRLRLQLASALSQGDTKALTIMALQETLILHQLTLVEEKSDRARVLKGMLNLLNQLNKSYVGHVADGFIECADRYLCRVQLATDTFFDEVTPADREEIEAVKAAWPEHQEVA